MKVENEKVILQNGARAKVIRTELPEIGCPAPGSGEPAGGGAMPSQPAVVAGTGEYARLKPTEDTESYVVMQNSSHVYGGVSRVMWGRHNFTVRGEPMYGILVDP